MKNTPHIVITGGPATGFGHIGPFPDEQMALTHAELNCSGDWWIVELEEPRDMPAPHEAPKVLIEVRGGVAEFIGSTGHVDVEIFDWDNWKACPPEECARMCLPKEWGALNPALPLRD